MLCVNLEMFSLLEKHVVILKSFCLLNLTVFNYASDLTDMYGQACYYLG